MKLAMNLSPAAVAVVLAAHLATAATAFAGETPKGERPPPPAPAAPADKPAAAPAVAAPGTLILNADADDLVAEVKPASGEAKMVGLKKGENKVEVPAGDVMIAVNTKDGRKISESKLTFAGGDAQTLEIKSRGKLVVQAPTDADVQLDGKDVPAQSGQFAVDTVPGHHSVVVQRAGHFGQKGTVDVAVGKTATIAPQFESYDPGTKKTVAWAGMLGGGALVLAAVVIDATHKYDDFGGDTVRWTLLGAGAAAFVGGTVMLKNIMDEAAPIKDTTFSVQVAHAQGGGVVSLAGKF